MTSTRIPPAHKNSQPTPPPPPAEPWTINSARSLYNVDGWGIGFFDINEAGHVVVRPDREKSDRELDLFELANDLEEQGVGLPLLLRFSDILRSRIESLNEKFARAREEYEYQGGYTTVYPIKVNQQRHVVEEIVEFGKVAGVGLECGSKPELQAVLDSPETFPVLLYPGPASINLSRLSFAARISLAPAGKKLSGCSGAGTSGKTWNVRIVGAALGVGGVMRLFLRAQTACGGMAAGGDSGG